MPYGAADLRLLCQDTGVPVAFGGVSTYSDGSLIKGLLDTPIAIKLMDRDIGGVEADSFELRLPFNAFSPMPADGDTLIVDGTTYLVDQPTAEDDGAFLCYPLKVTA